MYKDDGIAKINRGRCFHDACIITAPASERRKLLKVIVFYDNYGDGFATIPKCHPDTCPRVVIFVTAMGRMGGGFSREKLLL